MPHKKEKKSAKKKSIAVGYYHQYLKNSEKFTMYSPEEQRVFGAKAIKGCVDSQQKLIQSNLFLAVRRAKNVAFKSEISFEDALSLANEALVEAATGKRWDEDKERHVPFKPAYNPKKGDFTPYARQIIKDKIFKELRERVIRLPMNAVCKMRQIEEVYKILYSKFNREPFIAEIADYLGMTEKDLSQFILDTDKGVDFKFAYLAKNPCPDIVGEIQQGIDFPKVMKQIESLPENEKKILLARNGFDINGKYIEPQKLKQLGKEYGLTNERIRQIENQAKNRLWNSWELRNLKDEY